MNIVALIIQLLSGAVGGNFVGGLLKKLNLGTLGNTIAGILGGGPAASFSGCSAWAAAARPADWT